MDQHADDFSSAAGTEGAAMGRCPFPHHVPPSLVAEYDYREEPRIARELWEMAAGMADGPEIFWTTQRGGHWVVTSAAALEAITERPDLFSSRAGTIPTTPNKPLFIPSSLDPPVHGLYRKVMTQKMFSARALAGLEADVEAICTAVLDEFAADGRCDFVSAFAKRVPVDLFLRLMGADPSRRDVFLAWVEKLFRPRSPAELVEAYADAASFTDHWLDDQYAGRGNQGILFRAMQEAEVDGRALTREEIHNMTMMLFLGGLDTVVSQLTHIARFLSENPGHRQWLIDHPDRLPAAMEELLRRFGITNFVRQANADVEFHGISFRKGDLLLLCTPFANLDRRVYDDPLRVDFERARRVRHWGFGHGIHLCVGAHMARVQVLTALRHMLARLPDLRLAPGAAPEIESGGTFVIRALPLEWNVA